MFKDCKYTTWYYHIINKARLGNRAKGTNYYERHHIVPKSLGGSNRKDNLVLLTAREHYICHLLLMKMVETKFDQFKMSSAFLYMSNMINDKHIRYNSKLYEYHKKRNSKILSERSVGSNNHMFGKVHSEETRRKISDARIGVNTNTVESRQQKSKKWSEDNPMDHPDLVQKIVDKLSQNWIVVDPDGNEHQITNLKEFCKKHNLNVGNMCSVSKGKLNHYKKWKCRKIS